mgnify:CR=1 FL=1
MKNFQPPSLKNLDPKIVLIVAVAILLLGTETDFLNPFHPRQNFTEPTSAQMVYVDSDWLYRHLDRLVLLDVDRSDSDFRNGHIPGAGRVSLQGFIQTDFLAQIDLQAAERAFSQAGVMKQFPVVVYSGGDSRAAEQAFLLLEYLGHRRVHILQNGFEAWNADDRPVGTGGGIIDRGVFSPDVQTGKLVIEACFDQPADRLGLSQAEAVDYVSKRLAGCLDVGENAEQSEYNGQE